MNAPRWCRGVSLAVASVLVLSGCPVPIPPLGYLGESRTNLPDRVPGFIVEGKTTRGDVLLGLGEVNSEYRHSGRILLMSRCVLAIVDGDGRSAGAELPRYWIPFAQIARADTVRYPIGVAGTISLKDGRRYNLVVQGGTGLTRRTDGEATRGLVERINRALEDRSEHPDLRTK